MENYVEGFISAFLGAFQWTWRSILFEVPWYKNFFWGLSFVTHGMDTRIAISLEEAAIRL